MAEHSDDATTKLSKYMFLMFSSVYSITSLSDRRNHPNQLFIEDATDDDNSVARLSSKTMDKLQLFCGDAVKLKGKKRRETICIVLSDDTCQDDRIRVNAVVQNNLCVHTGDIISIQECQHVKYGTHIHVLPIDDTVEDIADDILREYLQSYFRDAYRPVYVGDIFTVRTNMCAVKFKVIETEPSPCCIVAPETVIRCEGEPIKRHEVEDVLASEIDFDSIGGMEDVKQKLKESIQCLFECPESYYKFGIIPSHGVLLYGPPGCGKFLLLCSKAERCICY
jgi:transitional endoplasmic reticulum ATPase